MGIATSMKELAEGILSSSEERANSLSEIKKETRVLRQEAAGTVKGFSTSRREAGRQLRRQLAQSSTDMKQQVMKSRDSAQDLIKGFRTSRKGAAAQTRKEMAQQRNNLVQNEKERKQQIGKLLEDFQTSRRETSTQLKNDLAHGKAKMKSDVKNALADAGGLINGYRSSRRAMGTELRNGLGKDNSGRKAQVEKMRGDFRHVRAGIRADLNEAADAWRGMASAIRATKGGGKAFSEVKTEKPDETVPELREKVLSIISQHTEGIGLADVAETLGVAVVVLGKAARSLLEESKVRREGKLYFPAGI